MSTGKIAKSAMVIGFATFCSRILGFIRDVLIARYFGTTMYAQAFVVAFRIPNLLRDMIAEGASNAAFVPVFSEYSVKKSKEEFWHLANLVLNILLVILSLITILGIIFAPLIVRIIAPGFTSDVNKLSETVRLTRIIYPYLLLIALTAYCMGILNSLRHFSLPAFAPCLLNISIIVSAGLFGENVLGLATGVLIGGLLQLAIQVPMLYRKGFRYKFVIDYKHPGLRQIGRLMLPRFLGSCIYQLNVFVDTILSSFSNIVGMGGVAALYFANRIFQFPLGIFGVAISQAALPTLSCEALEEDKSHFKHTLSFCLRAVFIVVLPVSVIFIVLAKAMVIILFQRGRFDAYSTDITSGALLFYSLGLSAYAANKVLVSSFFSLKDTVTPLKITSFSLLVNIVLNLILMHFMKLNGLALATTISGFISFFMLIYTLREKIGFLDGRLLLKSFLKCLFSCFLMGVTIVYAFNAFKAHLIIRVLTCVILGGAVFILGSILLNLSETIKVYKWIFARK